MNWTINLNTIVKIQLCKVISAFVLAHHASAASRPRQCLYKDARYKSNVLWMVCLGATLREYLAMCPMKPSSCWQESTRGDSCHSSPAETCFSKLRQECHNMWNFEWVGNLGSRISNDIVASWWYARSDCKP